MNVSSQQVEASDGSLQRRSVTTPLLSEPILVNSPSCFVNLGRVVETSVENPPLIVTPHEPSGPRKPEIVANGRAPSPALLKEKAAATSILRTSNSQENVAAGSRLSVTETEHSHRNVRVMTNGKTKSRMWDKLVRRKSKKSKTSLSASEAVRLVPQGLFHCFDEYCQD